jgi:4-hydroxybenzoyl-CoA reductase subunit beta
MITMPDFAVLRPQTLTQAVEMLAEHTETQILAGGSDLVVNLRNKIFAPRYVLDLKSLTELQGISWQDENLRIGALTTLTAVANNAEVRQHYPVLAMAAGVVAGPNIRNMGTLGGNICLDTRCQWYNQSYFWRKSCNFCLKKDGDVCHVAPGGNYCWAAYSGDTAPALLTLDAAVRIVGPQGTRIVKLTDFFILDGIKKYHLAPNEILTEVLIPRQNAGLQGFYRKLRIRDSVDYPLAGVAVTGKLTAQGQCARAQVAITAVNPAPLLVPDVETLLLGQIPTIEIVEKVADLARKTAKPMKTSLSTMPYRRHMIGVFVKQGLQNVLAMAK